MAHPVTLEAHQVCKFLRERGWTHVPKGLHPWSKGFHRAQTADEALAFERREDAFKERWGR